MTGDGLLVRAREARGVTRRELAERLKVHPSSVSDIEHRGAGASIRVLARYGEALGLRLAVQFITETGEIID